MPVVIDPNIKKESVRIDLNGNQIDPRTKQVIKPVEKAYVPAPAPTPAKEVHSDAIGDRISQIINEKVAKLIEQKIEAALKNL